MDEAYFEMVKQKHVELKNGLQGEPKTRINES